MKPVVVRRVCAAFVCLFIFTGAAFAKPVKAASSDGYVLLRVAKNTAAVVRQARDFTIASVIATTHGTRVYSLKLLPGSDRTRTFGATLPEGTYRLLTVVAAGIEGQTPASAAMGSPAYLDTFKVRAGQITWLDTLMFQPLGEAGATWAHLDTGVDPRALLAQLAPEELAAIAENQPPIGWANVMPWSVNAQPVMGKTGRLLNDLAALPFEKSDRAHAIQALRLAATEAEFVARMKKMPGQINGGFIFADGTALYGSSFGQIWKRAPSGTWSTLDTGCVCDILSVTASQDTLYAGTEFGVILRSNDAGATFSEVGRAANGDGIVRIDALTNGEWMVSTQRVFPQKGVGAWTAFTQRRAFYLLADPAQLANSQPARMFEGKYHDVFNWNGMDPPLSAGPISHGFAVLEPPAKLHRYDADTRTWQEMPVPKKVERLSFTHSGSVLFSEDAGLQSIDGGSHWTRTDVSIWPEYHSAMYDARTGVRFWYHGTTFRDAELYYTDNAGVSWKKQGTRAGLFCSAFGSNEVLRQSYCLGDDGIIRSSERGDAWTEETTVQ